jgi:hypothetical protein
MTDAEQPDGLYRVTTSYLCAGFVIADGRVTHCAPILRKRLDYWRTVAVPIRIAVPEGTADSTPPTP